MQNIFSDFRVYIWNNTYYVCNPWNSYLKKAEDTSLHINLNVGMQDNP